MNVHSPTARRALVAAEKAAAHCASSAVTFAAAACSLAVKTEQSPSGGGGGPAGGGSEDLPLVMTTEVGAGGAIAMGDTVSGMVPHLEVHSCEPQYLSKSHKLMSGLFARIDVRTYVHMLSSSPDRQSQMFAADAALSNMHARANLLTSLFKPFASFATFATAMPRAVAEKFAMHTSTFGFGGAGGGIDRSGAAVGDADGVTVGVPVGVRLGYCVAGLGTTRAVGASVGVAVGASDGTNVGAAVGENRQSCTARSH